MEVPPYVRQVLEKLEDAGFEAWCVGGCVRDVLLGRTPADWDVCSAARPAQAKAALGMPVVETGIRHGTITALTEGGPVEVTTFRREGVYSDHRRPDQVFFTQSLEEDLLRRDFTINAMAYHPGRGLRDPFGGQEDLAARELRCVGDPFRRFGEDALRVLRCLRFAAVLGFRMEPNTEKALAFSAGLLPTVSAERTQAELCRLLVGPWAGQVLGHYLHIFRVILPELDKNVQMGFLHILPAVPSVRWAALLWQIPREDANRVLERLRFPNREKEKISHLLAFRAEALPISRQRVQELLGKLGVKQLFFLLDLLACTRPAFQQGEVSQARALAKELLAQGACLSIRDLAVNGKDLLAMGFPAGPGIGQALAALLAAVQAGDVPNRREPLLKQVGEYLHIFPPNTS